MDIYSVIKEKNIVLPTPPAKGGLYSPCKIVNGDTAYISGCVCSIDEPISGKLGKDFTVEEGQVYARNCMLNILAVLQREIGDLNRVTSAVKVVAFVACDPEFTQQPQVANGATGLLVDIFGAEIGLPARSAVGVCALPGNIPVEVEAIFTFK